MSPSRAEFGNGEIGPAANEMRSTTPKSSDEWAPGLWRQSRGGFTNHKSRSQRAGRKRRRGRSWSWRREGVMDNGRHNNNKAQLLFWGGGFHLSKIKPGYTEGNCWGCCGVETPTEYTQKKKKNKFPSLLRALQCAYAISFTFVFYMLTIEMGYFMDSHRHQWVCETDHVWTWYQVPFVIWFFMSAAAFLDSPVEK